MCLESASSFCLKAQDICELHLCLYMSLVVCSSLPLLLLRHLWALLKSSYLACKYVTSPYFTEQISVLCMENYIIYLLRRLLIHAGCLKSVLLISLGLFPACLHKTIVITHKCGSPIGNISVTASIFFSLLLQNIL